MNNFELRNELKRHGFACWQLADLLGVSEATLTRILRHELPPERREHIMQLIETAAERRDRNDDQGI